MTVSGQTQLKDAATNSPLKFDAGIFQKIPPPNNIGEKGSPYPVGVFYQALDGGRTYKGGGEIFGDGDKITVFSNNSVVHEKGLFATDDGRFEPVGAFVRTKGEVVNFDGESELEYTPTSQSEVILPILEKGKATILVGNKREIGDGVIDLVSVAPLIETLMDKTKLWKGTRLLINTDNSATLSVGSFLSTELGTIVNQETEVHNGKIEKIILIKPGERYSDAEFIKRVRQNAPLSPPPIEEEGVMAVKFTPTD